MSHITLALLSLASLLPDVRSENSAIRKLRFAIFGSRCSTTSASKPIPTASTPRVNSFAEQHFNGADKDKDDFLSFDEFKTHAENRLAAIEKPKKSKP